LREIEALVIPADLTAPLRTVQLPHGQGMLRAIERLLGVDGLDKTPELVAPNGDQFRIWVDDVGLLAEEVVHNDRAIALCRAIGYTVPDMAGDVVLVGAEPPDGWAGSIPVQLRDHLLEVMPVVPARRAEEKRGRSS
jgi:hypothetical protein